MPSQPKCRLCKQALVAATNGGNPAPNARLRCDHCDNPCNWPACPHCRKGRIPILADLEQL